MTVDQCHQLLTLTYAFVCWPGTPHAGTVCVDRGLTAQRLISGTDGALNDIAISTLNNSGWIMDLNYMAATDV